MQTILINGKSLEVPSTWNELSTAQVVGICAVLASKDFDLEYKMLKILWMLTSLSMKKYKRAWTDEIHNALPAVEFCFKSVELTRNPLPVLRIGFMKYIGPADLLQNINCNEWADAESALMSYHETKRDVFLDQLIAILWRPKNYLYNEDSPVDNLDNREVYNEKLRDKRMPLFAKLSADKKLVILHFYQSCRQVFVNNFQEVFTGEKGNKANKYGWLSIYSAMANHNPAEIMNIAHQPVTLMLASLDMMGLERLEMERKSRNNK